jgi:hypothetical protein
MAFDIVIYRLGDDSANDMLAPFPVSFEQLSECFEALPRMLLEPDGSFVWTGEQEGRPWQLDGVVYDRDERVIYVEVKGECSESRFDELLKALGWPGVRLTFRLTREGTSLDEAAFRRHAEWG